MKSKPETIIVILLGILATGWVIWTYVVPFAIKLLGYLFDMALMAGFSIALLFIVGTVFSYIRNLVRDTAHPINRVQVISDDPDEIDAAQQMGGTLEKSLKITTFPQVFSDAREAYSGMQRDKFVATRMRNRWNILLVEIKDVALEIANTTDDEALRRKLLLAHINDVLDGLNDTSMNPQERDKLVKRFMEVGQHAYYGR